MLYDLAVQSEISGWNDLPCQNDPAFHVGRVCEGSHKYCISSYTTLNAMVEVSGLSELVILVLTLGALKYFVYSKRPKGFFSS